MNSKNRQNVKPASRDFVKILLCLGITCFLNAAPQTNTNCQDLVEEERPSTETISADDPQWMQSKMESKLDLESFKKMLPMSQQKMIEEALSGMDPVESIIELDSTPEFDSE